MARSQPELRSCRIAARGSRNILSECCQDLEFLGQGYTLRERGKFDAKDKSLVLRKWKVRALAVIVRKHAQPCGFAELEFVRSFRTARTKQPLPFRGARNTFDIRSVAIVKSALLEQILHAAVRALEI